MTQGSSGKPTDKPSDFIAQVERYLKLRATADPAHNASPGERENAEKMMKRMEDATPGLSQLADVYQALHSGKAGPGSATGSSSHAGPFATSPAAVRDFLAGLLKDIQPAAREFARDVIRDATAEALDEASRLRNRVRERARSEVRDFVRRVNPLRHEPDSEDDRMAPRKTTRKTPASRRDLTALFKDVEIAGIVDGGEDDDDSADATVCLSVLIPLDVAEALVGNDSPKVEGKIGGALVAALVETINKGESGEWPFFDDETEEEEEEEED